MKSLYTNKLFSQYEVTRTWEKNDETTIKMVETSIVPKDVAEAIWDRNKIAAESALSPIANHALATEAQAEATRINNALA